MWELSCDCVDWQSPLYDQYSLWAFVWKSYSRSGRHNQKHSLWSAIHLPMMAISCRNVSGSSEKFLQTSSRKRLDSDVEEQHWFSLGLLSLWFCLLGWAAWTSRKIETCGIVWQVRSTSTHSSVHSKIKFLLEQKSGLIICDTNF